MTQSLKPIHLSRAANDLLKLSSIPEEMFAPDDGQPNFTFDTPKQTNMIQKEKISLKKKKKAKRTIQDLKHNEHIGFVDTENDKGYIGRLGHGYAAVCTSMSVNMNMTYGFGGVHDTLIDALSLERVCCVSIKKLYTFPTRKDLYKWLAED